MRTAAKGHVWVRGPTTARICVVSHSPMLLPKVTKMPGVWATARDYVGVQEPCHRYSHTSLSDLCCHPGPWFPCRPGMLLRTTPGFMALQQPASESASVPTVLTECHVVVPVLAGHLGLCWCQGQYCIREPYRCKRHILLSCTMVTSGAKL